MQDKKNHYSVQMTTTTALMAAIIFVVTIATRIPIPFSQGGYFNVGDTAIYLGAFLLGGPLGAIAAAIGSALADLASGAAIYILPTAIIKCLMGLFAGWMLLRNKSFLRFLFASIIGGAIMVAGYAIFEVLFFDLSYAALSIPANSIQWAGGVAIAAALYPAAKRIKQAIPALRQEPHKK